MEIKNIMNVSITRRYMIGIGLIALLATMILTVLVYTLKNNETTALIVNMSGKQRMLSQRILSLAQQYHIALANREDNVRVDAIREKMLDSMDEMGRANTILSSGRLPNGRTIEISVQMREIYFGHDNIKARVQRYLKLASLISTLPYGDEQRKALSQLVELSDPLLIDLNDAVLQNQHEGEAHLEQMGMIAVIGWFIMLIVLLMEVILIFQPMVARIEKLLRQLNQNKEDLEHQVHARTLALEEANLKWSHLASHDPLTGLKNRLNMEQDLEKEIAHYVKNHIPYGVLMLDIDWFKKINDNYGHDAGDGVLCEFAKILKDNVRAYDNVYRSGGEEFVILFSRISLDEMMLKAESIRRSVKMHSFYYNRSELKVTASIGVFHTDLVNLHDVYSVLKSVDNALYQSKNSGRDKVTKVTFDDTKIFVPEPPEKIRIDVEGREFEIILYVDVDLYALCGHSADDMLHGTVTFKEILHPDDYDIFDKAAKRDAFVTTLRLRRPDESIAIVRAEFTRTGENSWTLEMQNAVALAQSVEDQMIIVDFNAMMDTTDDYIYFKDRNHVFTAGSKTLVSLTNIDKREEFIGKIDYELFPREYADTYFTLEKAVFSGEIEVAQEIQPTLDKDGNKGWVDNRKYPIKNEKGEIIGLFGIARVLNTKTD